MILLISFLLTSWTTEIVASDSTGLRLSNIVLDTLDRPHILGISYRIDTIPRPFYNLFLFSRLDSTWVVDTFEIHGEEPMPYNGDLTIDRFNRAWVIYRIPFNIDMAIIVARKDSMAWVKDTVSAGSAAYFFYSIAVDLSGMVHIAFEDSISSGVPGGFYAYYDTIWHKEIVDSQVNSTYWCSIETDQADMPHISYFHDYSDFHYELSHAFRENGVWYREGIDSIGDLPWNTTSIKVDHRNVPAIVYRDEGTLQIKCAYYDTANNNWHIDTIDNSGSIESQRSLDIDSLGQPHFIYTHNYRSWYAYKTASGWCKELLPLTPTVTKGMGGSLRIGKDGLIHIAQLATDNNYHYREIHYIYGTPTGIEENNLFVRNFQFVLSCSPNPFIRETKIFYQLDRTANNNQNSYVSLKIYDVTGRLVKTLVNGHLQNRFAYLTWNRRDENNQVVNSGIYFCELKTKTFSKTIKLVVLQ